MRSAHYLVLALLMALGFSNSNALGQVPTQLENQELLSPTADGQMGFSVATDGDVVVAGAPFDNDTASEAGAAYVYRRFGDQWALEQKLLGSLAGAGDNFGWSVDVSGDTVIVGAPGHDSQGAESGAIYVFEFDGVDWVEGQKLVPTTSQTGDRFGYSVAISGNELIGGAPYDDVLCSTFFPNCNTGSAYIFHFDGTQWSEEQQIADLTTSHANDWFGFSVAIDDGVVLVGAPGEWLSQTSGSGAGIVFAYRRHNLTGPPWSLEDTISAIDAATSKQFGYSVALDGDHAVVGAPRDDELCPGSPICWAGAAYFYEYNGTGWSHREKVTPLAAPAQSQFGESVAIAGELAMVGTIGATLPARTYLYDNSSGDWSLDRMLEPADGAPFDLFGSAVALGPNFGVIGSPGTEPLPIRVSRLPPLVCEARPMLMGSDLPTAAEM